MQKSLKIIRYAVLGGIFLIPFLVLIVTPSLFFPFITGKNFSFRILVEIIFSLWLVLAIFDPVRSRERGSRSTSNGVDPNYRPKSASRRTWLLIAAVAFTFVLILSTIFSVNPYRSFWSNFERMEGLLSFLHLFALFLVLTTMMNPPAGGERLWKWFFHISLSVSVIVGIYGLLQLAGVLETHQGSRLDATLGNSSYLAIYMIFHIFLALLYLFKTREWYRWFYFPVIVLETMVLYYTATRGAILGFIVGLLLAAALLALFSQEKKIKIFAASAFVSIVVFAGIFLIFKSSPFVSQSPVLSRFSSISLSEQTTQSRLVVWKMSWQGFKEKPLLGWGLENYNLIFNKYYQPILWKQEPWFDRAHNVFFDRLTTNGIIGLFAYLGLFACSLYCLWKKGPTFAKGEGRSLTDSVFITSMFAAYFIHNLFVFDNITSLILFFSILAYISAKDRPSLKKVKDGPLSNSLSLKSASAMIVGIAMIFIIYFINVPAILASRNLIEAFKSSSQNNAQESFQWFQKAISRNSFGSTEAREHLVNFSMQVFQQPNIDNDFKTKVVDYAVLEMKKQIEQATEDIRYMVFLGTLYNKVGQYDKAVEILSKAAKLAPNKQMVHFELATSYLNKKDYEKTLDILKKAFELAPEYLEARKIYAMAAIFAGQDKLAEDLMKDYGGLIVADERILRAFIERGDIIKITAILEKFIEQEPNNAQYRVSLAAGYLQSSQRQKAIEQLQKAIDLEPKFKQQGEYYINEIRAGRNP
ncbi:MAG: O-antigen ligase family protein [Candidatus Terrybacteria bacterium]|nr:O-antigen ligase family protein [Candidatus Terrybacteria bacterium]